MLLVQPEAELSVTTTDTYSPPIGLASIATFCKNQHPDLEIKIIGSYNMTHQEQINYLEKFKPDILGLSPTISSQKNAYEIAETTKEKFNSINILGGVNSTQLWGPILNNRKFIDAIILYDGHFATSELINRLEKNQIFENIPNVTYRKDKEIVPPKQIFIPSLEQIPDINYSLLDMDTFSELTEQRGFGKAISYAPGRGCSKRGGKLEKNLMKWEDFQEILKTMHACSFCGRNEIGFDTIPYIREIKTINRLNKNYGITGYFNIQDTVSLLPAKAPKNWEEFWFRLFITSELASKQKNIDLLKNKYSENLVFQIGIESANEDMLRKFGKFGHNTEYFLKMNELLNKNNIQLHATFVLGGPGETKKSLKETSQLIKELSKMENVTWIGASPEILLPGSPDYVNYLLLNPNLKAKYKKEDLINVKQAHKDMLKYVSPEIIREDVIGSIKEAFTNAKKNNPNIILDGKGLTPEEEKQAECYRPYLENPNWKFRFAS